jgi:hypothetical protein
MNGGNSGGNSTRAQRSLGNLPSGLAADLEMNSPSTIVVCCGNSINKFLKKAFRRFQIRIGRTGAGSSCANVNVYASWEAPESSGQLKAGWAPNEAGKCSPPLL